MLDIKYIRENPELVKQNMKNKFQNHKLGLVDEVLALDDVARKIKLEAETLRAQRNANSKQIGLLMSQWKKVEADELKRVVEVNATRLAELEILENEHEAKVRDVLLRIPNIIDPSVPLGKDDTENVEVEKFGEPSVPDFDIPYHTEIMEKLSGIDLESARKVAGNGFY